MKKLTVLFLIIICFVFLFSCEQNNDDVCDDSKYSIEYEFKSLAFYNLDYQINSTIALSKEDIIIFLSKNANSFFNEDGTSLISEFEEFFSKYDDTYFESKGLIIDINRAQTQRYSPQITGLYLIGNKMYAKKNNLPDDIKWDRFVHNECYGIEFNKSSIEQINEIEFCGIYYESDWAKLFSSL